MATIAWIEDDEEPTVRVSHPRGDRRWTLLLAEDDDDLRNAFARSFRSAGFDVRTARDGHHVFEHLAAAIDGHDPLPDALVMDVRMPLCSGLDVLRAFRAAGWKQPVILVTGHADEDLKRAAATFSASLVVEKPIDAEAIATIARFIAWLPGVGGASVDSEAALIV